MSSVPASRLRWQIPLTLKSIFITHYSSKMNAYARALIQSCKTSPKRAHFFISSQWSFCAIVDRHLESCLMSCVFAHAASLRCLTRMTARVALGHQTRSLGQQTRFYARKTSSSGSGSSAPPSRGAASAPPSRGEAPPPPPADPWQEVKDPSGSAQTYWWNTQTNEVTPLGAAKPGHSVGAPAAGQVAQPPPGKAGGLMGITLRHSLKFQSVKARFLLLRISLLSIRIFQNQALWRTGWPGV